MSIIAFDSHKRYTLARVESEDGQQVQECRIPHRRGNIVEFLCWLAFFVPDFPLTLAWTLLLDPSFGFLNSIASALPFVNGPLFNPYSFWGIVWVHLGTGGVWLNVMLLTPIFRRLGAAFEEAARVAGANTLMALLRITFPVLSPMIIAIAVLSFIKGLESFNVELLLGSFPVWQVFCFTASLLRLWWHEGLILPGREREPAWVKRSGG